MLKKIARNDNIFKSENFLKDAIAFNVMISIVENPDKYPNAKIFSDGKDCIIVCSDFEHPVIVWTPDEFNNYASVWNFVKKEFSDNKPFKIMSKIAFYDFLKNLDVVGDSEIKILGAYQLNKLNDIEYVGRPDSITESEIPIVAELYALFGRETGENKNATAESCMTDAADFINNPLKKVWRDTHDKIVAITLLRESDKYARIGHVITAKDERGKSYAKMLVHFMSKYALDNGKKPMLFTDFEYEPSNKCYPAVGYELVCNVVNFEIKS